jgi:hypothetical protein
MSKDGGDHFMFLICWRYLSMDEFEKGTVIVQHGQNDRLLLRSLSKDFLDAYLFL